MEILSCCCSGRFSYLCLGGVIENRERDTAGSVLDRCEAYFRDWSSKSHASQAAFRSSSSRISFLECWRKIKRVVLAQHTVKSY